MARKARFDLQPTTNLGGRSSALTSAPVAALHEIVAEHKQASLAEIYNALERCCRVRACEGRIWRASAYSASTANWRRGMRMRGRTSPCWGKRRGIGGWSENYRIRAALLPFFITRRVGGSPAHAVFVIGSALAPDDLAANDHRVGGAYVAFAHRFG